MVIVTKFIAGYKKEDLLTPDIIIRVEEKATSVILYLSVQNLIIYNIVTCSSTTEVCESEVPIVHWRIATK